MSASVMPIEGAIFYRYNEGILRIIRRSITDRRLSARHLEQMGAIRNRLTFLKRLESGCLTSVELDHLFSALELDATRAYIAIICMGDPEEYFGPICETAALVTQHLAAGLLDKSREMTGEFDPLRNSICSSLANQTVDQIMAYQDRIETCRASSGFEPQRLVG